VEETCEECGNVITRRAKANVWKGEKVVCTPCLKKLELAGWRGEEVADRPSQGNGPFIYFRRGNPPLRFNNSSAEDTSFEELGRWEL
jgi:hypothetical protein